MDKKGNHTHFSSEINTILNFSVRIRTIESGETAMGCQEKKYRWLLNGLSRATPSPREEQFTSAVVIGELYKGAYRSQAPERHLTNIKQRILPAVTVLPYDIDTAKIFGRIRAYLEGTEMILPDADIQIASTALGHNLELVTGNLRHFRRISGLKLNSIITASRNRD